MTEIQRVVKRRLRKEIWGNAKREVRFWAQVSARLTFYLVLIGFCLVAWGGFALALWSLGFHF